MAKEELKNEDPDTYRNYLRVENTTFKILLARIGPVVAEKNT